MEVIKKIVNIRDFIEKFGGKEPYLHSAASDTNTTSYGRLPYDILVNSSNNAALKSLPKYFTNSGGTFYGEVTLEEGTNYGVKFGTFAYYYSWLRKFIMESEFYACGQRKNNAVWVETAVTETFNVRRNIFASAKGVFGGLPNAEDYTCGEDIVCISENADTFYNMFSEGMQDATAFLNYAVASVITGHYPTLSPFLELPLLVDRDIDDLGYEYMAFPEEWKSGVTYNSGVSVTHEGYIYQRIASSGSETTFDADKWLKLVTTDSGYYESGKTYFMESQLKTLTRQKRLLDVDGNEVEFVSGSTCGHELKYVVNVPQNIVYNEELGTYTYNCMYSITRYDAMGDEAPLYDFNKSNIGQKGRIKFVYYVNCFTDSSDTEISSVPCNGVKYTEEYDYEIALSPVIKISAFAETEAYLKIDYTSGYMPEWGESGKTYAKVELETTNEEWLSANTFIRYDTVVGTTDVKFTSDEVRIDRGASASYEALNVIGEVNTIEDIEKYRNDWFRIKGKNN